MSKIKNEVLMPREYLEKVTGKYFLTEEDTCEEVETILNQNGFNCRSYRLEDIEEAMRNNKRLALVELCDDKDFTKHYFRWFVCPEVETETNDNPEIGHKKDVPVSKKKDILLSRAIDMFKILADNEYSALWDLTEDFTVNGHTVSVRKSRQFKHVIIDNAYIPIGGNISITIDGGRGKTFTPIEFAEYILTEEKV